MKQQILVTLAVTLASLSPTVAADGHGAQGGGNNGNGNGNTTLTLVDGDAFRNPGEMFQYLRTRTDATSGNPKEIVDAYPNSFDSVGDLIQQKRDATSP